MAAAIQMVNEFLPNNRLIVYTFRGYLNSMSYTNYFCRYFVSIGNTFMIGVRLVPSMGHRQIVSGAVDGSETANTVHRKCCI